MSILHRRSFLERLSLGAGAAILSPMVRSMVAQAQGAATLPKRFVVLSYSNGGYYEKFIPPEYARNVGTAPDGTVSSTAYTMPAVAAPLAPLRNKMVLLDGLANRTSGGHFGWTLLTAMPKVGGGESSPLGGKSLDQHLAPVLGKSALFPSVHLGATTGGDGRASPGNKLSNHMFAKAAGQPVPVQLIPEEAFKVVFPLGLPTDNMPRPTGPRPELLQQRKLLDYLGDDIKRLRTSLSSVERGKLDEYLASIEDAQRRLTTVEKGGTASAGCGGKINFVNPTMAEPDEVYDAQLALGTAALICGVTNVLTLSFIGIGKAFRRSLGFDVSIHDIGHGKPGADQMIEWFSKRAAQLATRLDSIKEGNGTMLDNTVILFANDNNETHHSRGFRYPVVLIGGGNTRLRTDGRYLRLPYLRQRTDYPGGPAGLRSIADLMSTLSHALGAPVDNWAKGAPEVSKGPISELLKA